MAGGLVMLTAVADRFFAHRVSRREWIGVALAAAGLAFLAATVGGSADSAHSGYTPSTLALFVAVTAAVGVMFGVAARTGPRAGVMFGAASGLFWAVSDTSIKALSGSFGDGIAAVVVNPLAAVVLIASGTGMLFSARSLQLGPVVPVIALTAVAANSMAIAAGPIVFSDPLPSNAPALAVRILAFALVICAAALTPAPLAVEGDLPA
jgi:drug/metabolite transporter (DMT)-like permease